MPILVLRAVYFAYIAILLLTAGVATSRYLFSHRNMKLWFSHMGASVLWPVALMSGEGRRYLGTIYKGK